MLRTLVLVLFAVAASASALHAVQAPPPHSQPEGFRRAPLPQGEGGSLVITAPPELCLDNSNEFHLHEVKYAATHYVLELTAGPSACEWTVSNLQSGTYETLIQQKPDGRIWARGFGEVANGSSTVIVLQRPLMEVQGRLTRGGHPSKEITLSFRPEALISEFRADASINADGSYRATLDAEFERFCAVVSAPQSANLLRRCDGFYGGVQQMDLDVAPGIIRITIPPIEMADSSTWSNIDLRSVQRHEPTQYGILMAPNNTLHFQTNKGFRGDYIGLPHGDYTLQLSIGPYAVAAPVAVRRVSISPEDETTSVLIEGLANH